MHYLNILIKNGVICEYKDESVIIHIEENRWESDMKQWFHEHGQEVSYELAKKIVGELDSVIIEEAGPISPSQERILNSERYLPGANLYQQPETLFLYGNLNYNGLEFALNATIKRQKSLRTVFRYSKITCSFMQAVRVFEHQPLDVIDLSTQQNVAEGLHELIRKKSHGRFSLRRGPLFQYTLVKLSDFYHVLLFSIHHVISDAASTKVFFSNISAFYNSYVNGAPLVLPHLDKSFIDCCKELQKRRSNISLSDNSEFWNKLYSSPVPPINFSKDKLEINNQISLRVFEKPVSIPTHTVQKLKAFCKKYAVTLNSILLSSFAITISKLFNSKDIPIGTVSSNKIIPELEHLIGFTANLLILRFKIDKSFDVDKLGWLKNMNKQLQFALANQELPFQDLVEQLERKNRTGEFPLFQIMFVIPDSLDLSLNLKDLNSELKNITYGKQINITSHDLRIQIVPQVDGGYLGSIICKEQLFSEQQLEKIWFNFCKILEDLTRSKM